MLQPIKTAPTDGTIVLGLGLPEGDNTNENPDLRTMRARKIGNTVCWSRRNGFGDEFTVGFKPTHWMPHPDPAMQARSEEEKQGAIVRDKQYKIEAKRLEAAGYKPFHDLLEFPQVMFGLHVFRNAVGDTKGLKFNRWKGNGEYEVISLENHSDGAAKTRRALDKSWNDYSSKQNASYQKIFKGK